MKFAKTLLVGGLAAGLGYHYLSKHRSGNQDPNPEIGENNGS